jgi:hypothetical protein
VVDPTDDAVGIPDDGGSASDGVVFDVEGGSVVCVPPGTFDDWVGVGRGSGLDVGFGPGDAWVGQRSSAVRAGGRSCVAPESPVPQTQPSMSPSPIRAEPAPVDAHVHPPAPSPCQYPQYSG